MSGSLRTLFQTLTASALLAGVSLSFGEEKIAGLDPSPNHVVVVPVGGPWSDNGYARGIDPDEGGNAIWMTRERIDIYCYAHDPTEGAGPVDHADAVESLRTRVLQALLGQQNGGLFFKPTNGTWMTAQNEISRFGRAYVISLNVDISVVGIAPIPTVPPQTLDITTTLTSA